MSTFFNCPIFKGIPTTQVAELLEGHYATTRYRAGKMVALQSSLYDQLFIVSEGKVSGEMTDELGRTSLIEEISAPRAIAPAFLFATENRLPVTIVAMVPTEIVTIPRVHFISMMQQNAQLLTNFLQNMSDRSRFLSDKLQLQRFGTIRSKLARYLMEVSAAHAGSDRFTISHTQQQLADQFGVTRPALARSIAQLEAEGILRTHRKEFEILNRLKLREG